MEIKQIPILKLCSFEEQPFKVLIDKSMEELVSSIRQVGILSPIVVRNKENGLFEILSGHRRVKACEIIGVDVIPAIIKDMDDDMAAIFLVDSNLQRENILPSERAFAYKMRLDAMKRKAGRRDNQNGAQIEHHFERRKSRDVFAEEVGQSSAQIQRYIRLTNLIDPILDMVDNGDLAVNAAVELSYLGSKHQSYVLYAMESEDMSLSIEQAKFMRSLGSKDELNQDSVIDILRMQTKSNSKIIISRNKIKKYFPQSYTEKQIENIIVMLLKKWYVKGGILPE